MTKWEFKESDYIGLRLDIMIVHHNVLVDRQARINVHEAAKMAEEFYAQEMELRSKLAAARNKENDYR